MVKSRGDRIMTKQEQVKQMEKERIEIKAIMKLLDKCVSLNPMCKSEVATVVYGNNYRKLPEDSVVLSREEYEKLKGRAEEVFNEMTERMKAEVKIAKKMGIIKGRKETAEKIYCVADEICTGGQNDRDKILAMIKEQYVVKVEE